MLHPIGIFIFTGRVFHTPASVKTTIFGQERAFFMKQRIFSMLLALAMLFGTVVLPATAEEVVGPLEQENAMDQKHDASGLR